MEELGLFHICVVISCLVGAIHANRCHPCEGSDAVFSEKMNTCDHLVSKESVLMSMKSLNYTLTEFRNKKKTEYNIVDPENQNFPACVQSPIPASIKNRIPRRYKDRFIHETFAKLSYAYDVLEYATNEFEEPYWRIQNELKIAMCNMVKVNRKLHCKKNRNELSRSRLISFNSTTVCQERDVFLSDGNTNSARQKRCILAGLDKVNTVVENTLEFWESCVMDSQSGKLVLKGGKKCRKRESKGCSRKKSRKLRRRCKKKNRRGQKQRKLKRNKTRISSKKSSP